MTGRSIHWYDGMFMLPHHMQQEEHFRLEETARQNRWNVHYNWGLRALNLDLEPLKTHRLVIRSLRARMKDGTVVDAPEDCPLPSLDLKPALANNERITVYLAVPKLRENQPNIDRESPIAPVSSLETRYRFDTMDLEDENTGADTTPVHVRRLNFKLLLEHEELAGYEVLPILRVQRHPVNQAEVSLDNTFIPPLLACDAWQPLAVVLLQGLYDRIGSRLNSLANQVVSRNISFDSRNTGDAVLLGQLAVLNEAAAGLNTLAFAEGIHPLQAYLELCRLVGQLAIYQPSRKVPELPRYDHDDLGFCFTRVMQHLEAIELTQAEYIQRSFVGEGLRLQVALESRWLEPAFMMFVGVTSTTLKNEEVVRLLTKEGQLDMKIGSADRVDLLYEKGQIGLDFKYADRPPRDLPVAPNLTFFQVNMESRKEEWLNVRKSLKLAIRFNQKLVVDAQGKPQTTLQGLKEVIVRVAPSATTKLQFVLYIVPRQS